MVNATIPTADAGPTMSTARKTELMEEEVNRATVVTDGRCQRKGSKDAADILMTLVDTPSTTATATASATTKSRSVVAGRRKSSQKQEKKIQKLGSEIESANKLATKPDCTIPEEEPKHPTEDNDRHDGGENDDSDRLIAMNEKKNLFHTSADDNLEEQQGKDEVKSTLVGKKEVSSSLQEYDNGYTKNDDDDDDEEKEEQQQEEQEVDPHDLCNDNDGDDCIREGNDNNTNINNDDDDDDGESCSSESQSSHSRRSFFIYGCYNNLCNRDDNASHNSRHHDHNERTTNVEGIISMDSTTTRTRGSTTAFSYPPTSIASNNNSTTFRTRSVASLSFFSSSFDHDDGNHQEDAHNNDTTLLEKAVERLTEEKRRTIVLPDTIEPFKSDNPQRRQQEDGEDDSKDNLPSLNMVKPPHKVVENSTERNERVKAIGTSSKSLRTNFPADPSTSKMPRISSIRSSSSHPTPLTSTRVNKSRIVDSSPQTEQRTDSSDESNERFDDDDDDQPIIVTLPSQQDDRDEIMSQDKIVHDRSNHKEEDEDELEKMVHELKRMKKKLSRRHHPYLRSDGYDDHIENDESIKTLQNMIDDLEGMKFLIQSKNTRWPPTDKTTHKKRKNRWLMKIPIGRTGRKSLFEGFSKKRDDNEAERDAPVRPEPSSDIISSADRLDDFRSFPSLHKKGFRQDRHRRLKAIYSRIRSIRRRSERKASSDHASPKTLSKKMELTKDCCFVDENVNTSVNTASSNEIIDQQSVMVEPNHHTISDHNSGVIDLTHATGDGTEQGIDDTEKESIQTSKISNTNISTVEKATDQSAVQRKSHTEQVEGGDILDNLCENFEKHLCHGCARESLDEQTLHKISRNDNTINDRDDGLFIPHKGPPIETGDGPEFIGLPTQKRYTESCLSFFDTTSRHAVVGDHKSIQQSKEEEMYVEMTLFEIALMMAFGGQDMSSISQYMETQLDEKTKTASKSIKDVSRPKVHCRNKRSDKNYLSSGKEENDVLVSRVAAMKQRSLLDVPSMCEETSRFMEVEIVEDLSKDGFLEP